MAKKKILILAANPKNAIRQRLDEEVRDIEAGLERSKCRDQFEIVTKSALRTKDIRHALLDVKPTIVHFTGQGAGANGLIVEGEDGSAGSGHAKGNVNGSLHVRGRSVASSCARNQRDASVPKSRKQENV